MERFNEPQTNGTDRFIHTVVLDDLDFGTYFYYVYSNDAIEEEKTIYSFEVNNWKNEKSNLMMVYADLGVDNDQLRVKQEIQSTTKSVDKYQEC